MPRMPFQERENAGRFEEEVESLDVYFTRTTLAAMWEENGGEGCVEAGRLIGRLLQ